MGCKNCHREAGDRPCGGGWIEQDGAKKNDDDREKKPQGGEECVFQPRAELAGVQPAGFGAGGGRPVSVAGAAAVFVVCEFEPGRVLRDPGIGVDPAGGIGDHDAGDRRVGAEGAVAAGAVGDGFAGEGAVCLLAGAAGAGAGGEGYFF